MLPFTATPWLALVVIDRLSATGAHASRLSAGPHAFAIGVPAESAEENQLGEKCANPATREVLASSIAPSMSPAPTAVDLRKPVSEQKPRRAQRGPTEGRMGLGAGGQLPQIAQVGAKRSVADLGSRGRHRASHHGRGTLVAQRHLRPLRPMRYAYRRPGGFLALLFGW